MKIPDPMANYGDDVLVLNYRNNIWEHGIVTALEYRNTYGEFYWHYDVDLVRRSKKGNLIRLYTDDEGVRSAQLKELE